MYFNKERFISYLKENEICPDDESGRGIIVTFQRLLKNENTKKTLQEQGIFHATEDELAEFLAINDADNVKLTVKLNTFIYCSDKFLYQISTDALEGDEDKQQLALTALERRASKSDLHAAYNLIMIKYQLKQITGLKAKQELQVLKVKVKQDHFEKGLKLGMRLNEEERSSNKSLKIKHGKEFARVMAMLHKGDAYITACTHNVTDLPLFETSKGEKRRSKLALTTFTILTTLILAAAIATGLIFGGYIVILPTFLAWAAPIALSLLIGLSVATGVSATTILAEAFKPKAIKYFFQGLGRTLKKIGLGAALYFKGVSRYGAATLHVNPYYQLDDDDELDRISSETYQENWEEHRIKTLLQFLLYPFACLFGAVIGLAISPVLTARLMYKLVKKADEPVAKASAVIGSILTWPLSFIALLWIEGNKKNAKIRGKVRERLFDDASRENLPPPTVVDKYAHMKATFDELFADRVQKKKHKKMNSRLASLEIKLASDIAPLPADQRDQFAQQQIDAIQIILNGKNPYIKRDGNDILQNTRFIDFAYTGFNEGIFTRPPAWPATIDRFNGQPDVPPPPAM